MKSQVIEFIDGFEKRPSAEPALIQQIMQSLNLDFPSDYLHLFSHMNGGEGFIGDNYCRLYPIENIIPLNQAFMVKDFAPGLFIFGSNGGGEAFSFDTRNHPLPIVKIPFIPLDFKYAKLLGTTIHEFFINLSNHKDDKTKNISPSINKALIGKEIHEIQPIIFGGDPLDPKNKAFLNPEDYAKLVVFWNRIYKDKA